MRRDWKILVSICQLDDLLGQPESETDFRFEDFKLLSLISRIMDNDGIRLVLSEQ